MTPSANVFSQTLPRNFTFHYDEPPKTPEPIEVDPVDTMSPPEPPRQTFKLKRRRAIPRQSLSFGLDAGVDEYPVHADPAPFMATGFADAPQTPSIEINPPATPPLPAITPEKLFQGSSSPVRPAASPISPPRTPHNQMMGTMDDLIEASRAWETVSTSSANDEHETGSFTDWTDEHTADEKSEDEDAPSRPTTAGGLSFASSLRSQRTIGTNLTSPEQADQDPFSVERIKRAGRNSPSPYRPQATTPKPASPLRKKKNVFTKAMEAHLWKTYNLYRMDPTHTPFKMFPGQYPSHGVACRVARVARKSWKGPQPLNEMKLGHWSQNAHGKRTKDLGGVAPPEKNNDHLDRLTPWPKWPRSDRYVRAHLHRLVAREHDLKPYYTRLMHQRTPSIVSSDDHPSNRRRATSSERAHSRRKRDSEPESFGFPKPYSSTSPQQTEYTPKDTSAFSTRDMNISLAASTSSTMGYDDPMHQLGMDPTTPRATQQTFASSPVTRAQVSEPTFASPVEDVAMTGMTMGDEQEQAPLLEGRRTPSQQTPVKSLGPKLAEEMQRSDDEMQILRGSIETMQRSMNSPPLAPRAQVHQKSQSLHYGFRAPPSLAGLGSPPQLGSPFAPGPSELRAETIGVARGSEAAAKRPQLGSPLEFAQPVPKRRAVVNNLERSDAFAAMSAPRRAIRNRGYTVDHAAPSRGPRRGNVFDLFDSQRPTVSPPPPIPGRSPRQEQGQDESNGIVTGVGLMPPLAGPPRLRSPFEPDKHSSTLPFDFGRRRPKTSDGSPSSPLDVLASACERERRRSSLLQITKSRLDNPPNF